jgi:LmbE family N-acetylglucosaminyl deacetylase
MNGRTLLASFAHPDDEAFGCGGTLAHYASMGYEVDLVCATRGEVGEISDPALATPETLGEVREQELRCAANTLGLNDVIFLGYRDSGMAGTEDNNDPRAFCRAAEEEVVERLVGIIRKTRPQVILTFEPEGGYGHPDHMAISRHTVSAFHAAADPNAFPAQGPAWQASRLYYPVIPRSFFTEARKHMEAMGIDTSQFGHVQDEIPGWPDEWVNCSMDVSDQIDAKLQALQCHKTQMGTYSFFQGFPTELVKEMLHLEHFAKAWPEPSPGQRISDLFAGMGQPNFLRFSGRGSTGEEPKPKP